MRVLRVMALIALGVLSSNAYSASKTILVLGDSLSAEYGIARSTGWVTLMQTRLKTEKFDASIVNASISGETTSGGKIRLPALLEKHHPDIVVIELGANDGLRGLSVSAAEANLLAIITAAKNAHAKILLIGIRLPPNYGDEYTRKFFSIYAKLAKKTNSTLVPFLLAGVSDQQFQPDRLHPIAEAHPLIQQNVWTHLKPLLSK